jgi:hypothetical protein
MFEKLSAPLASKKIYHQRVIRSGRFALAVFVTALSIGVTGYHFIAQLDWVDAFLNASMILGGMGEIAALQTNAAKIFAGCYALFSGVTFLSTMAVFLSPIVHRLIHKLHIDISDGN